MGGQRLVPPVIRFPVPAGLGDTLQKWSRTQPDRVKAIMTLLGLSPEADLGTFLRTFARMEADRLKALEKLVIYLDAQDKDEIYGRIAAMGKSRR